MSIDFIASVYKLFDNPIVYVKVQHVKKVSIHYICKSSAALICMSCDEGKSENVPVKALQDSNSHSNKVLSLIATVTMDNN